MARAPSLPPHEEGNHCCRVRTRARGVSPGNPNPMTTRRYAPLIVYGTAPPTGKKPSTAVEGPSEPCPRGTLARSAPAFRMSRCAACPCSGSRCWPSIHPSSARAGARAVDSLSSCIAGRTGKRRHARREQPEVWIRRRWCRPRRPQRGIVPSPGRMDYGRRRVTADRTRCAREFLFTVQCLRW